MDRHTSGPLKPLCAMLIQNGAAPRTRRTNALKKVYWKLVAVVNRQNKSNKKSGVEFESIKTNYASLRAYAKSPAAL
jgi:hypothetical protein